MILVVLALTLTVSIVVALTVTSRLLVICGPRELLVVAGRGADGLPYSVLRSGRMLRTPGVQRVFRLPIGVFEVPFSVRTCDRHHVPVTLSGVASLRIGDDDASIARAAARLLGLDQQALTDMGERMVRATVGGVAPMVDAVQLVEEPRFTQERMMIELQQRVEALGLRLDALRIEDVRDDGRYIEARQAVRRARS